MAPSLRRRLACFIYEALVLFGISLIPGLVGAIASAQGADRQPWHGDAALRIFAFVFYGIYFVGFWSSRGQTLPMQTWHIRVETRSGAPLDRGRAAVRYLACWVWIAPPAIVASISHWTPWQSLGAVAAWIAIYAALALLHPQRQFWHDALCRTQLVDFRPAPATRKAVRAARR